MEVTYKLPYAYMSGWDHSASLSVGHRCLGTQVTDRGLAEVLTSPNKRRRTTDHLPQKSCKERTAAIFDGSSRILPSSLSSSLSGSLVVLLGGFIGSRVLLTSARPPTPPCQPLSRSRSRARQQEVLSRGRPAARDWQDMMGFARHEPTASVHASRSKMR